MSRTMMDTQSNDNNPGRASIVSSNCSHHRMSPSHGHYVSDQKTVQSTVLLICFHSFAGPKRHVFYLSLIIFYVTDYQLGHSLQPTICKYITSLSRGVLARGMRMALISDHYAR